MSSNTMDRLTTLIVSHFGGTTDQVTAGTTLEELDFDSLALVELAMVAQKEFGVEVSEDEFTPEQSVQGIAELIETRRVAS